VGDHDDDDRKVLKGIARRLAGDAQLRLIWVLQNHIGDNGGGC